MRFLLREFKDDNFFVNHFLISQKLFTMFKANYVTAGRCCVSLFSVIETDSDSLMVPERFFFFCTLNVK